MARPRQHRIWICRNSLRAATGALALAIVFVLTVVATPAAQAQTFTVLHNFTGGRDGANPYAGVTMDQAGGLYGTTLNGGLGAGAVYKLTHRGSGWTFDPLFAFTGGSTGFNPLARVTLGPQGILYGTTGQGGFDAGYGCVLFLNPYGCGVVFSLRPQATAPRSALTPWSETVLYEFQGPPNDGASPVSSDLMFDQGNIYSTTRSGGTYNDGTVYEMTGSGSNWTESVLYSFAGGDGKTPYGGVIFDNARNLYGTTYAGGLSNVGTVFELTKSIGWTEGCLYSFRNGSDGSYPYAGLVFDASGNLYGATSDGGSGGGGVVFKLTLGANCSWTSTPIYSFTGTAGKQCGPSATLAMRGGNLYGTTYCDGAYGYGNVFELSPSNGGWTYTALYDFTGGNDGGNPISNVVFDASGNLYGTASTGGSQTVGVVWEIMIP